MSSHSSKLCWLALMALATTARAQAANGFWVSGVGDDANPCTRTAPCRTLASALALAGEGNVVFVLDPIDTQQTATTIGASVTIDGHLAPTGSPTLGPLAIAAGAADVVVLRHISVWGGGATGDGIDVTSASAVILDDVEVSGFTQAGINVASTANTSFFANKLRIENVGGAALVFNPAAGSNVRALTRNTFLNGATLGVWANGNTQLTVVGGSVAGNAVGISASGNADVNVRDTVFTNNAVAADANAAIIRIARSQLMGNGSVQQTANAGQVVSFSDNVQPYVCPNGLTLSPSTLTLLQNVDPSTALSLNTTSTSPVVYRVSDGALPDGVTLSGNVLRGAPTVTGDANFTVIATDSRGCSVDHTYVASIPVPDFTVSLDSNVVHVPSEDTAHVVIAGHNGVPSGTFSLSCDANPYVACSFSPSTLDVAGGATTSTLTLTPTTASARSAPFGVAPLLMMGMGATLSNRRWRRLAAALMLACLMGCGSSPTSTTTATTTEVTVRAINGDVAHTTSLSVTVG